ncbi:MAG: 4-(cytidine 5'-diphospho)-2-C-methyl-D-erythritol kinase [Lachnospiraceae bacterium]|nr:4-(cytidine 5'-diphospho)-2-C-methyl-D-erythritol kinase [Lachnospiraceae bacterium]
MEQLYLKAMGKINLGLDVVRKREDGYHEVRMIMQTVGVYDRISLKRGHTPGIHVTTNLYFLPVNENNLVYKAAQMLMEEFQVKEGLDIHLQKYIPVAAGMAGGSADAATVLYGVNRMFRLGLSQKELMERGVRIGADVPYCLMRGTALSEGIGEVLTRLPAAPACKVIIAKPGISVSTKYVYGHLDAAGIKEHPDIDGMIEAIQEGSYEGVVRRLGNVLETVTQERHPVIGEIKELLTAHGADGALMSGSGPTVFGLFREEKKAREALRALEKSGLAKQMYLTGLFSP